MYIFILYICVTEIKKPFYFYFYIIYFNGEICIFKDIKCK